jgi:phosphoglycolate phosphatase
MKTNKHPTVLFDFDGTIAQTLHLLLYLPEELLTFTALKEITHAEIDYLKRHGLRKFIQLLKISPLRLPKMITELQHLFAHHIHNIPLVEGITDVLTSLHERPTKIGIITSNTRHNVEAYLEFHRLDMVSFVYADRSIFGKHRVISKVLKEQRINPAETVYIGDEVRDVEAAKKSGIRSAAVSWGFSHRENLEKAQPNWLFDKPEELMTLF